VRELRNWVGEQLGAIAKPDEIRFTDNLPKTRSGKIMRRLLRSVARGEEISQDVSTLENPAILDQLRGAEIPSTGVRKPGAGHKPKPANPKRRKPAAKKRAAPKKSAKRKPPAQKVTARKSAVRKPTARKPKAKTNTRVKARKRSAARKR